MPRMTRSKNFWPAFELEPHLTQSSPMLVVRPAGPADLDSLMELAILSGRGFTSLPEDGAVAALRLIDLVRLGL